MKKYIEITFFFLVCVNLSSCQRTEISTNTPVGIVTPSSMEKSSEVQLTSKKNQLQQLLDQSVAQSGVPGLTMYISTPNEQLILASGVSSLETKKPMAVNDLFRIGSVSKTFVAVTTLQLAQEQKIDLDAPIKNYLSSLLNQKLPNTDLITVRDLLKHTSGLVDYTDLDEFYSAVEEDLTYEWTAAEILEFVDDYDAQTEAGEVFAYSNTNYILLEVIIEGITGHSLAQEIRNRISQPLGLNNTFMELKESIPDHFVQGYSDWDGDGNIDNVTTYNDGHGLGDGGLISNVLDLGKFAENLFRDRTILSPQMFEEMFMLVSDNEEAWYGLGVGVENGEWGEIWGHDGKTTGFLATMNYLPDWQLTIVVLGNDEDQEDQGDPSTVMDQALKIIFN